MHKLTYLVMALLTTLLLVSCTATYTMTTRSGAVIQTQGKPESDSTTGLTKYADAYGYHRQIQTSEIVRKTENGKR